MCMCEIEDRIKCARVIEGRIKCAREIEGRIKCARVRANLWSPWTQCPSGREGRK